ncbi:MAG: arsenite methyltransferase [Bacteroides sp.]|jgi:SAM-dependent methyltransferase|nr:arsenite methyltransferase [Bacteroides sp.]
MKENELKRIVKEKYGQIVLLNESGNGSGCCGPASSCCGGADNSDFSESYEGKEGYLPDADLNLGCGIPTEFAGIKAGHHVLDLGSGAGNDCFVARALVGENGQVTGIDFTDEMVEKATRNATRLGYPNVRFLKGDIEAMPLADESFDVVLSNCVLNLVPDKRKAFSEIQRVLKPGGRFCISDVVLKGVLPPQLQQDAEMYAGCVSGALQKEEYLSVIHDQGFAEVIVHKEKCITLSDDLLVSYLDEKEMLAFKNGESGIFSMTVSGVKKQ